VIIIKITVLKGRFLTAIEKEDHGISGFIIQDGRICFQLPPGWHPGQRWESFATTHIK